MMNLGDLSARRGKSKLALRQRKRPLRRRNTSVKSGSEKERDQTQRELDQLGRAALERLRRCPVKQRRFKIPGNRRQAKGWRISEVTSYGLVHLALLHDGRVRPDERDPSNLLHEWHCLDSIRPEDAEETKAALAAFVAKYGDH